MSYFQGLRRRRREPEVMDDPGLDPPRHVAALRGLARLNLLSSSVGIVWSPIKKLARQLNAQSLRILDVATGAGDIPLGLWRKAQRANLRIDLQAVDISPQAIAFARERADRAGAKITFHQLDVLNGELPQEFDVVISSLFFHHLEEAQIVSLLRSMANATRHLVLVNDLRRNAMGLMLAYAASRLFTRSDVVHTDAPLSVKAAMTMQELHELATAAGLEGSLVQPRWPCRMLLTWRRP